MISIANAMGLKYAPLPPSSSCRDLCHSVDMTQIRMEIMVLQHITYIEILNIKIRREYNMLRPFFFQHDTSYLLVVKKFFYKEKYLIELKNS